MKERNYKGQSDLRKLQQFLSKSRNLTSQASYFQFGDLIFRMHKLSNKFNNKTDIRIWYDDYDEICGFVFYLACENNPEFFIRPDLYYSQMADDMISWTISRAKKENISSIQTSCIENDKLKEDFLKKHGFSPNDDPMVFMEHNLDEPTPDYLLPSDYSIITQKENPEIIGIYEEKVTKKQNDIFCKAPGYINDFGLRVCYKNREIVSSCIFWYDDIANCVELEPVSTNQEHRKKGLAFSVIAKAIENLKKYHVKKAYVRTDKHSEAAINLYKKLGFKITDTDNCWEKEII